jgi:hypothetical protein
VRFFIKHPNTDVYSASLTFAVWALVACLIKFMLNGVTIEVLDKTINFGTTDAGLIAALLTPTLAAYASKKFSKQRPEKAESEPS